MTHELLEYEARDRLDSLACPWHLTPVGHVDSMPVKLAQWASGKAAQPMKTAANYDHFLERLKKLPAWIAQAMANMERGIARGIVLPRPLVERTMPQLDALLPADPLASPYLAATLRVSRRCIGEADRRRITAAYRAAVLRLGDARCRAACAPSWPIATSRPRAPRPASVLCPAAPTGTASWCAPARRRRSRRRRSTNSA